MGIVIGILSIVFVILVVGYIFGKDYWRKRHSYGWYNTITTPSSWFDSCCDCDFQSTSSRRSGATITHVTTVPSSVRWIPCHVYNFTLNDFFFQEGILTTSNQPTATFVSNGLGCL